MIIENFWEKKVNQISNDVVDQGAIIWQKIKEN